jgi:hypothetical protein
MTRRIEFLIKSDGTIVEKVLESSGNACIVDTAPVESALGEVISREMLPEYYENLENLDNMVSSAETAY